VAGALVGADVGSVALFTLTSIEMFLVVGELGVVGGKGTVVGSAELGLVDGVGSDIVPNNKYSVCYQVIQYSVT